MTKRWIVSGVALVALLAATAGIAYAVGSGSPSIETPAVGQTLAACEAMHDSPGMQAMHDHMPAALQERCDVMHDQMDQMMSGSGMMDGSGMMSCSTMTGGPEMGGGSMADHHPSAEG